MVVSSYYVPKDSFTLECKMKSFERYINIVRAYNIMFMLQVYVVMFVEMPSMYCTNTTHSLGRLLAVSPKFTKPTTMKMTTVHQLAISYGDGGYACIVCVCIHK